MSEPSGPRHPGLLHLFPRVWRERYADEFLAMLDQRPPGARDLLDILVSAADARLRPSAWLAAAPERLLATQPAGPATAAPRVAPRTSMNQRRFTRRTFLRNAVLGGVGVAALGVTAGGVAFAWPNRTGVFGSEVTVPREAVPAPGTAPFKHTAGKFWLINNEDGALALYWQCKHLGCTVPWEPNEGQFHCPCHGSLYDRHGDVVRGPTTAPLDLMALRFDPQGNAIVDTGEITPRHSWHPDQSVPPPA